MGGRIEYNFDYTIKISDSVQMAGDFDKFSEHIHPVF